MITSSISPVFPKGKTKKRLNWAEKFLMIENSLKKQFIGQDTACSELAGISASFINLTRLDRKLTHKLIAPRVLISGGTSQGKTSLSLAIARELVCPHSIINCGAITPEGYKGMNISDGLLQLVQSSSQNEAEQGGVLIIDEVCKLIKRGQIDDFHQSSIYNLLGILGGEKVLVPPKDPMTGGPILFDTKNILVILCGIFEGIPKQAWRKSSSSTNALMKFGFPSELIGRISHIIPMDPLSKNDIQRIVERELENLLPFYQSGKSSINLNPKIVKHVANQIYKNPLGIRHAKMLLHQELFKNAKKNPNDDMFNK